MFAEPRVTKSGNTFTVRHYVDAQNSFGAQLRSPYTCRLTYNGGDWADITNWSCEYLELDGKTVYESE